MIELSDKIRIISIHSAKGGVGKTTLSQLLAHMLLTREPKQKKRVVIMNLDFGGTTPPNMFEDLKNDEELPDYLLRPPIFTGEDTELLTLFQHYLEDPKPHIAGLKSISDIVKDYPNRPALVPSGSFHPDSKLSPMLLFDQIFSIGFMEFIFNAMEEIAQRAFKPKEKGHIYFILDNPPGYSQLTPVLEKKLFECGPDKAKLLFVGTADEQDLEACSKRLVDVADRFVRHKDMITLGCKLTSDFEDDSKPPAESEKENTLNDALIEYAHDDDVFDTIVNLSRDKDFFTKKHKLLEDYPTMIGFAINKIIPVSYNSTDRYIKKAISNYTEKKYKTKDGSKDELRRKVTIEINSIQFFSQTYSPDFLTFYQKNLQKKDFSSSTSETLLDFKELSFTEDNEKETGFSLFLALDKFIYNGTKQLNNRTYPVFNHANISRLCWITRAMGHAWDLLQHVTDIILETDNAFWHINRKNQLIHYTINLLEYSPNALKDWVDNIQSFVTIVYQKEAKTHTAIEVDLETCPNEKFFIHDLYSFILPLFSSLFYEEIQINPKKPHPNLDRIKNSYKDITENILQIAFDKTSGLVLKKRQLQNQIAVYSSAAHKNRQLTFDLHFDWLLRENLALKQSFNDAEKIKPFFELLFERLRENNIYSTNTHSWVQSVVQAYCQGKLTYGKLKKALPHYAEYASDYPRLTYNAYFYDFHFQFTDLLNNWGWGK